MASNQNNQIMPVAEQKSQQQRPQQPRPRRDLQGLLKFCMEATKSEDAPANSDPSPPENPEELMAAMPEENREWLRAALNSLTVDVIQQLVQCIEILNKEDVILNPHAESTEEQEGALDCAEDWVGQIDTANNFQKLGGFDALALCLRSPHESLVTGAANLIAELASNNPHCQTVFVDDGFVEKAVDLLRDERSTDSVKVKALYALSAMVRASRPAGERLAKVDGGYEAVAAAATSSVESPKSTKLRTKGCFFLQALFAEAGSQAKAVFTSMGLIPRLITVLSLDHDQSHEHVSHALLNVLIDNEKGLSEAKNPSLGLKALIEKRSQSLQGKEEHLEEVEYLKKILQLISA